MVIVTNYQQKINSKNEICIKSLEQSRCPVCSQMRLKVIGSRKRNVTETVGNVLTLRIRRLKCSNCNKIHHELPCIIVPYKRYCLDAIEKIIADEGPDVCCENSTISRTQSWWRSILAYFISMLAGLKLKYDIPFAKTPLPGELVRFLANENLWVQTRSAFHAGSS